MATKLMIIFFAVLSGVMIGLSFAKRINQREKYFNEIVRIIDRLISDIKFSQQRLQDIIIDYQSVSPQLSRNLTEYIHFLKGEQLELSKGVLTKREYRLVMEFFLRLGSLDLETQLEELENQKQSFISIWSEAKKRNNSFGKALIKLGFLGGLLIGILLL